MGTCRVVIEREPRTGSRNMAVDEALLEAAIAHGACTVRWYRWAQPTVSLGYFQDAGAIDALSELAGLTTVRRLSGGGAILHHHEWTYSCAVPADHPYAKNPGHIYDVVHEAILDALVATGAAAATRGEALSGRDGTFLCFGRGDARDLVLNGHKIVGSAQRRRRGAVLQHGSLLLRRSAHAPQFPGLLDLHPGVRVDGMFIRKTAAAIGSKLGMADCMQTHEPSVESRAAELESRYQTLDWRPRQGLGDVDGSS